MKVRHVPSKAVTTLIWLLSVAEADAMASLIRFAHCLSAYYLQQKH